MQPCPPTGTAALLHRLGPPPGIGPAAVELLEDAIRRSAERAWQLASGDAGDDPLLAELRLRGSASTQELSEALGLRVDVARARLRELIAQGVVHRTGHARSTRFHA